MQFQPKQVIVIGDSRHTDMLGAWLVGCPSIQVATFPPAGGRTPRKTSTNSYPSDHELWDNDSFYNS